MADNKFLNIKKTKHGYEYAERKGVHSIAFILVDKETQRVGLRLEHKPPINAWLLGAFGGSIDPKKSLIDIVINEVREEAGYEVTASEIEYKGKYFVSTQMNQFCYLFTVCVGEFDNTEPTSTNPEEQLSSVHWMNPYDVNVIEDWKAIILMRGEF
jgi:8-oxo-dGTP pyrophosphatase MutT (NUDIX family)